MYSILYIMYTIDFEIIRDLATGINDKSILMLSIRRHFNYIEHIN